MPKSSKRSSEKDALSFIKKVAAAGRGGDTELAYLSTNARALLKKLGGAGTVNPKTKLPEYRRRRLEDDEDLGMFGNRPVAEPGVGSSAADLEQILAASAPQPTASMLFDASSPGAESPVASPEPGVAVQREVTPGFDAERQYTPNPQAPQSPQQEPTPTFSGMAPMVPEDFASQYKPGSLTTESGKVNAAFFDPAMDRASIPNVDPETLPKAEAPAAAPGSAADDLSKLPVTTRQRTPEQIAELRAVREQEDLWRSPAEREPLAGGRRGDAALEAERRAAEESARRAAEEEAARRAAEESARRAAEEEASRRAQEDAARRAAEEAAARRAQEEAARMAAEEEARRRAAQDAAAARAAEEARRLAEAEAARRAQEEAARRAAEEEARRRAEQAKPQPEPRPQPQPQPQPPPGLNPSPLPTLPKPPTATPPSSGGGITTPPEKEKPFRTADFIDKNLNGIDDRDEKPSSSRSPGFDFSGLVDPNSDVGRLINRLGRGSSGRGSSPFKRGAGTKVTNPPVLNPVKPGRPPSEQPPPSTPGNPPPTEPPVTSPPVYGGYTPGPIPVTTLPKPGYVANPLPKAPGAGTSTPYFTPNTGGLTPGTLPVSGTLPSLGTSQLPLQAIGQNPNLSPTMLGGEQNAGYYTDRFGNKILSPVARGFAKGGSVSDTDLLALLKGEDKETYAESLKNFNSARGMLESMSGAPGETRVEFDATPVSQTVRRATRQPIRQETDKGTAKGMAMELESLTAAQEPKRAPDTLAELLKMSESVRSRDAMSAKDLMRDTFGTEKLTKKQLSRLGDLMTRRFAEGGPVEKKNKSAEEELKALMLRGNPEAQGIEEAAAAAPKVPETMRALGRGFYEANVAPLLSPRETLSSLYEFGKQAVRNPVEAGRSVVAGEKQRLQGAAQKPESAAEYLGGMVSPFNMLRRVPDVELTTYQGSPYLFEPVPENPLGAFDIKKQGTGVGQQNRGPGTYLAENPRVANRYRIKYGPVTKTGEKRHPGYLYTVDLPDPMIERMIDLDTPVVNQPKIRETLLKIADSDVLPAESAEYLRFMLTTSDKRFQKTPLTGYGLIAVPRQLGGIFEDVTQANTVLQRYGIPGSKWKDDVSRGPNKGTSNFVVFPGEEKNLKILSREGPEGKK